MSPRRRATLSLALVLPVPSLAVLAAMVCWPGSPWARAGFLAAKLWTFGLPLWWLAWVERRRWFGSPPTRRGWGWAVGSGAVVIAVVWAVYGLGGLRWLDVGLARAKIAAVGLGHPVRYLAGTLYWVTVNSVLEEMLWRWFVVRQLRVFCRRPVAVIAAALAFTTHHALALSVYCPAPVTALACLAIFAAAVFWSWLYDRAGSLWPAVLSHALADVAVFSVGYHLLFLAKVG